jgi:hypothetical protein
VKQLKNPPPPALMVNVLSYVSGYFLWGLVPTDELQYGKMLNCPTNSNGANVWKFWIFREIPCVFMRNIFCDPILEE